MDETVRDQIEAIRDLKTLEDLLERLQLGRIAGLMGCPELKSEALIFHLISAQCLGSP